ncbi:hypothetical protein CHLNCDRAFT_50501 [Chlorella variabilis]|uniref:ZSWIM1/3 RNaseH-like domain-containing protein n=1 Tax=Chlorella variabilis TaxID=554065 RepID=E1Z6L9_CHLVA|nr:hypothetical protein CHLNCDRAFT_50501 [Chlorella variabilis]EFN58954.1 hypothetical protein CHLNCDRAFT_50501 [Chlorella variabilis]|eukprot:XP_005851056.1 hypothetical protein CHLNCDRAFT_50501 [Chlorella variabilis]
MQVSFQARMLDQFGRRLVFMDATFGVNKYGYPLYALVVQDESGRGVPVSFMVCSSDTAEVVEHFLRTSMEGAQAAGDGTFKYKSIMIDKSKTEIAAVDQLVSTWHAEGYLLGYFHFLQDWERFLSSGDAGVPKAERHRIMLALARLAHMQDQAPFKQELAFFILSNSQQHLPVAQRMHSSWVPCAEKWAWWGRLDVLDLQCNTNNLGERNFGLIKYTDLERRAQLTLHELLLALLTKTVPRNIQNRAHMLAGRVTSNQQQREQRAALWVQKLRIMIKGRVFQQPTSEPLGDDWGQELRMLTRVRQTSATAIKQVVTNADDTTAATRADLNYVGRTVADLPEGEEKQALCQAVKDLRSKAEEMRQAARLEPTKVRAGKQARRKQGRNEQDRLTRALLTRKHKSSLPLAQQTAAAERSDPLPTLRQKDKSAMKMRGPTVPGNRNGTTLRNNGSHHRVQKKRRTEAAVGAAV